VNGGVAEIDAEAADAPPDITPVFRTITFEFRSVAIEGCGNVPQVTGDVPLVDVTSEKRLLEAEGRCVKFNPIVVEVVEGNTFSSGEAFAIDVCWSSGNGWQASGEAVSDEAVNSASTDIDPSNERETRVRVVYKIKIL